MATLTFSSNLKKKKPFFRKNSRLIGNCKTVERSHVFPKGSKFPPKVTNYSITSKPEIDDVAAIHKLTQISPVLPAFTVWYV